MPRTRRIVIPDVPLHVTQRGNNRCAIFHSRADRALYLALLREGTTRARCALHAYVLMSNHVHLLITPSTATSIADLMHRVSLSYARNFNASYGRTGTLWEGRFKSAPIGSERYFLACSQYIEAIPYALAWSSTLRSIRGRASTAMRWEQTIRSLRAMRCTRPSVLMKHVEGKLTLLSSRRTPIPS